MGIGDRLMKIVVKVKDAVELARCFEASPVEAMREVVREIRESAARALEQVMEAEIELFLGQDAERGNKRNGFRTRVFAVKGLGAIRLRVPRDRRTRFQSVVIPAGRRYDEATEKDLALLNLSGLSTRMLSYVSTRVLGVRVSPQEVSNALSTIVPAARKFLERPLTGRRFQYLYLDGTNFPVRRTTVEKEPTLVVIGVDEGGFKSLIAMVQGDKESRTSWEMVFSRMKERGLDPSSIKLGIMDGLPGLEAAFEEAFPRAKAARCWVHKARNVFPLVPRRYQAEFKKDWDQVQYAGSGAEAKGHFESLERRWKKTCADAVDSMAKDIEALLAHYEFPQEHWEALRTTNPIERVNKEFKRRAKPTETVSPDGLKALLAFTALRLEYGWMTTPITSNKLARLKYRERREAELAQATRMLLN